MPSNGVCVLLRRPAMGDLRFGALRSQEGGRCALEGPEVKAANVSAMLAEKDGQVVTHVAVD